MLARNKQMTWSLWKLSNVLCMGLPFLLACGSPGQDGDAAAQKTLAPNFGEMVYLTSWLPSGQVTLEEGVFRQPVDSDTASKLTVRLGQWQILNSIHGQKIGAVILVTETGGTGTFYDLALLVRGSEFWFNSDLVHLGDRVQMHALEVINGKIKVDMTVHGPNDPQCCPRQRVAKQFAVQDGKLIISD